MATNRDDTPNILLLNQAILALEHLADDVRAHVRLVVVAEDDVLEAGDANLLRLLRTVVLPMVVDALTKLHSGSQTQILIN